MTTAHSSAASHAAARPAEPLTQRRYARILVPFVLSTATQPLLGAVDTAVMGHMSDPYYIAGVAVGAVIFNFFSVVHCLHDRRIL